MSETRFCEHCGAALAADARFCEKCGRAVAMPTAPTTLPASTLVRSSRPTWLIVGCLGAVVLIACIAVIGVGGFFYFQSTVQERTTPTLISIFVPSTPTRVPTLASVPPTLPPPTIPPTIAPAAPSVAPSATPKCPPAPALPAGVLFSDDFASRQVSECNGWDFRLGEATDYSWTANQLTITPKRKQWIGMNWPNGEYDNFGVEVQAQPSSTNYTEYGIVFRASGTSTTDSDTRSHYIFGLRTDGKYYLQKKISGKWIDPDPVAPVVSSAIKQGGVQNTVGVIAQGNTISLYINRVLVKALTDDSITGKGKIGIFAATGSNDTATAVFSKVVVSKPDQARAEWSSATSTQPTAPGFNGVTFSTGFDDKAWSPVNPGKVFPYGVRVVYAYWTYNGLKPNSDFEYEWRFNNARVDGDLDRLGESSGKSVQWLTNPTSDTLPLVQGAYQFSVRVGGQVVVSDSFVIQ